MTGTTGVFTRPHRVAVLWTHLSGYLNACLRALAEAEGVELFVSNIRVSKDAPYDEAQFDWIRNRYQWEGGLNAEELLVRLDAFRPDVIVSSGWNVEGHRHILKKFRGRAVRFITMDNQWRGTFRQYAAALAARFYLHPLCDAAFVAGDRQAMFARKLGFPESRILRGLLSCDQPEFAAVWESRKIASDEARAFVYVGRFSEEKGLDVLISAYRAYRAAATDPWPLRCYGAGKLQGLLAGEEGVEVKGFCQPADLPQALRDADCLILSSIVEPWGLVVHEAASSGMAIICTDAVGASSHLVKENFNGYVVKKGDAEALAFAMLKYVNLPVPERRKMAGNSYGLSLQFTPQKWAAQLLAKADELFTTVMKR